MNRTFLKAIVLATAAWLATLTGCVGPAAREPTPSQWEEQVGAVAAGRSARIEITSQVISDQQFAAVAGLKGLRELIIEHAEIRSESLKHLTAAVLLDHLRLRGARINDSGVAHLRGLKELRVLNLPQAELTDAGIKEISALPNLELLRFGSRQVTDDAMKHIANMKGLRFLHTIGVPLTDGGLVHLQQVEQIESLYLDRANVTDAGLSRLIQYRKSNKLPAIHLHIDQQHHDLDPRAHSHDPT